MIIDVVNRFHEIPSMVSKLNTHATTRICISLSDFLRILLVVSNEIILSVGTLYPPTQIMSEGKPVTPMDVETTEAPSEGGKCGCLPCKHAPKGKSHSEFMEYHDRRCTNLLCLLIYVAFMIAWAVVGSLAFKYGTPDM